MTRRLSLWVHPVPVIALLAAMGLLPSGPAGPESFCDPGLESKPGATTYRMRVDRCEGIFAQQVSSPHLEIRSLVGVLPSFNPKKDSEVVLAWTAPPGNEREVQLRAFSFKPLTFYRMDTRVRSDRSTYHWPADVLSWVGLGRDDLGLLAWTDLPELGGTKPVYLPLRAGTASQKTEDGYTVKFLPATRLSEVHVKVSRLDGQRKVSAEVRDEKLVDNYYPPGEPAEFSTGKLGPAGFYRITITATPKTGLSIIQDFDLYHPGD